MPANSPRCPTCRGRVRGAAGTPPFPFCSARCKLADLGSWLDGRYVVSTEMPFDEQDDRSGVPSPVTGE